MSLADGHGHEMTGYWYLTYSELKINTYLFCISLGLHYL